MGTDVCAFDVDGTLTEGPDVAGALSRAVELCDIAVVSARPLPVLWGVDARAADIANEHMVAYYFGASCLSFSREQLAARKACQLSRLRRAGGYRRVFFFDDVRENVEAAREVPGVTAVHVTPERRLSPGLIDSVVGPAL